MSLKQKTRSRARTLTQAVAVNLAVAVCALFLASEWFIARKAKTTLLYDYNPYYRQELRPDQLYARDGFSYIIGAHGLRGTSPPPPKAKGTLRIAVMGGSSVFDFRVQPSWPERLQLKLRASGLQDVEVMNAAVPGFSTREIVPFFEHKVRAFQPDVVLLYSGWNDLKYMKAFRRTVQLEPYRPRPAGAADHYAFLTAPRPQRNVYALQLLWQKILLRVGGAQSGQQFVAENRAPPAPEASATGVVTSTVTEPAWSESAGLHYYKDNVRRFIETVRASGAEPIIVCEAMLATAALPASTRRLIAYHYVRLSHDEVVELADLMQGAAQQTAAEMAVTVFDPRPLISGHPEFFHDHVHLSEGGSEALAAALAPQLEAWLRAKMSP